MFFAVIFIVVPETSNITGVMLLPFLSATICQLAIAIGVYPVFTHETENDTLAPAVIFFLLVVMLCLTTLLDKLPFN